MFEGLRKKFSNFIGGLANKEKEEAAEQEKAEQQQAVDVKKEENVQEESKTDKPAKEEKDTEIKVEEKQPEPQAQKTEAQDEKGVMEVKKPAPKPRPKPAPIFGQGVRASTGITGMKYSVGGHVPVKPKVQEDKQEDTRPVYQESQKPSSAPQPKVTFTTRLKSVILRQVKISEKDADPFIEGLKIDLLQSDVNYDVAEKMAASIRNGLVGKPVDSKNIDGEITESIRGSIMNVLSSGPEMDIVKMINQKRENGELPFKIMFIGPNGAGKTTTMAKIASLLLSNNITCVLSASDTFRAAAIEQTVFHGSKLGIGVIKGNYGSDPASIAFDAIAHAKAHGIMAVLIDSAGRQETNKSLIEELKKMTRVTAPDLKIFVGEAISGNTLLDQVKAINEAVQIDGIILTKLDVDAKGGNTISILSDTTVPILFFGTGEKYSDLMRYDPKFIIDSILPADETQI